MGGCNVFWWWIGNIALLVVVAPEVVLLANRVLRPTLEINTYAGDVLEHGRALAGTLDALPALDRTRDVASQARQAAERYGSALQRLTSE